MNENSGNSIPKATDDTEALRHRISELESLLQQRDQDILKLRSQLNQAQNNTNETDAHIRHRAEGISTQPHNRASLQNLTQQTWTIYKKSETTLELLKNAILNNDYLKNLESRQIKQIIDSMYPVEYPNGSIIIKEGDVGSIVYVLEDGRLEVSRENNYLGTITAGQVIGELALLYDCKRTATVTAVTACLLWAIDRHCFLCIMMRTGLIRQAEYTNLLKNLEMFKGFPEFILIKIADVLEEIKYNNGEYIAREGAHGDTFFIVYKGQVKVTQNDPSTTEEQFVRTLLRGDFFGENSLQGDDLRIANFIADSPDGAACLVIDQKTFTNLTSSIHDYKVESDNKTEKKDEFTNLTLADLNLITIIGVGGFARVALVQIKGDSNRAFALKRMKKADIVKKEQQQHVMSEKEILLELNCNFIVKLYKTFKDPKYLYLLMECCIGGELWTLLRDRGQFDDVTSRFYAACVLEAFKYMHSRNIVYRDLKSENLLLDVEGYVKLVDFGFAKKLEPGHKTWTFCGTLEYVAPEVILNRGHDASRDYWSLGVLIFEFLTGVPPFTGDDPAKVYKTILKGINAVEFPYYITTDAADLIRKMCRENPTKRLGCTREGVTDIQKHRWFDGFNWEGLVERTLAVPYSPMIESVFDSQNFDHYTPDISEPPPDDLSGWDKDF